MAEKYIVVELQKTGDQVGSLITAHDTLKDAHFKFYSVAAAASISDIDMHTAVLLSERGLPMERICFEHNEEATSEE
jgi:hypothetical protein